MTKVNNSHFVGKWFNPVRGDLLHFYYDNQTLMLARYQTTPISLILEQDPIMLTDEMLSEIKLEKDQLITSDNEYVRSDIPIIIHPMSIDSAKENFDVLAMLFEQHYAFFALRNVNWKALVDEYRARITSETTPDELFSFFKEMLSILKDNHIVLAKGFNQEDEQYFSFYLKDNLRNQLLNEMPDSNPNDNDISEYVDVVTNNAVQYIKNNYFDRSIYREDKASQLIWGILKDNSLTGYLNIRSMEYECHEDDNFDEKYNALLDNIIDYFNRKKIENIIIDVRFNQGGSDHISLLIANRFAVSNELAFKKQIYYDGGQFSNEKKVYLSPTKKQIWKKDIKIALLTSPITASAAETFTLALSCLPHVTRIGDATMGILSDQFARRLPNGWWVTISKEVVTSPDDVIYENTGIPVKIKTDFPSLSILNRMGDPGIQAASSYLKSSHFSVLNFFANEASKNFLITHRSDNPWLQREYDKQYAIIIK